MRGMGDAAACLSGHVKQNDGASGILLYQGINNAGDVASIVATSDWPIAIVAQETGVCQTQWDVLKSSVVKILC